jgi:uncharacterized protein YcgI (DUF1989 family)
MDDTPRRVNRFHLEPRTGTAFALDQGQVLRIVDVEGEQVADLVCFARGDVEEVFSSARTIDYNETVYVSTGNVLYSNWSNPMLTILSDRVAKHDLLFAPCSQEMFRLSYGITEPHPNCLDNLAASLAPFGIKTCQIPTAFNVFMNARIAEDGRVDIRPPLSRAGDYIDLRAEMDLIVAVTACSAAKCNNYRCTAIDVEIYAPSQGAESERPAP